MTRLNVTLPDEIAKKLAEKHNKSRFIAQALKEKFAREKKLMLREQLIEGYKTSYQEDNEINSDWEKTDLETWE